MSLRWNLNQIVGDKRRNAGEISCIQFNHDGEFLAIGQSGKISILQRTPGNINLSAQSNIYKLMNLKYDERNCSEGNINNIRWLKNAINCNLFLSTHNKEIKFWKLTEERQEIHNSSVKKRGRRSKRPSFLTSSGSSTAESISGKVTSEGRILAHNRNIDSLAINADLSIFLSADGFQLNLWNFDRMDFPIHVVDTEIECFARSTRLRTVAEFHPTMCNVFAHSTSSSSIDLSEMRGKLRYSKSFTDDKEQYPSADCARVSDVKFTSSGRYMISRDYTTLKVWDIQMERNPVETYRIHKQFRSNVSAEHLQDCIDDQFQCCVANDELRMMTGTYNNCVQLFNRQTHKYHMLQTSNKLLNPRTANTNKHEHPNLFTLHLNEKVLHTAWHPKEDVLAVAAQDILSIFGKY